MEITSEPSVKADNHFYQITETPGSYNVTVGGAKRKITWVTQSCSFDAGCQDADLTPSYLPIDIESNPLRNTVTLQDGSERELIIDNDDPSNVDIAPDHIQSFDTPDLKIGDRYFITIDYQDGSHGFKEAYVAKPEIFVSDKVTKEVTIDGKVYTVTLSGVPVRASLERKNPVVIQKETGKFVEAAGRIYSVNKNPDTTFAFSDAFLIGVVYRSDAATPNVVTIQNKTYDIIENAQTGEVALREHFTEMEIRDEFLILDDTYFRVYVIKDQEGALRAWLSEIG